MTNIFEVRTFSDEEKQKIKDSVLDTIECLSQIKDLQEHIKENQKSLCDQLNEKYGNDKEVWVKPTLINKMAKTKMKEDLDQQKSEISEVEDGLQVFFKNS